MLKEVCVCVCRSEVGILTSTALLNRIIRQVTSEALLRELVYFLLGEERGPQTLASIAQPPLRHRLIEHCDHLSDEVITHTPHTQYHTHTVPHTPKAGMNPRLLL